MCVTKETIVFNSFDFSTMQVQVSWNNVHYKNLIAIYLDIIMCMFACTYQL